MEEDYIEKIPDSSIKSTIEIKTDLEIIPRRITIEYELSTEIKDIRKENKDEPI
jgi:hypothetical protein